MKMNTTYGGAIAYIRARGDTEKIRAMSAARQREHCESVAGVRNTHITDFYTDRCSARAAHEGEQPQLAQLLRDLPRLHPKYVIIDGIWVLVPANSTSSRRLEDEIRIHEISLQILRQGALLEIAVDTSHITK
jgi:hypothetical protein